MTITFFVKGEPVPKQSFRKTRNGGYIDPRVTAWADAVGYEAKQHVTEIITTHVSVRMNFYLSNNRRVDCDNLSKNVLDGLKGIVFNDDSQVHKLVITKTVRKENPGVQVFLDETILCGTCGGEL